MKKPEFSVMLTCYKRPHALARQIKAVRAQTVPIREIWLCHNTHAQFPRPKAAKNVDRVITIAPNLGVWARFLFCQEFETNFIAVFDDDTIPGKRWLENCVNHMAKKEGLYGANGIIFPTQGRRPYTGVGWKQPNEKTQRVDIVGHSWVFLRGWLRQFAHYPRPVKSDGTRYRTCGEDYHFSFSLQKGLGLNTYVPPHPLGNQSLWGSTQGGLGRDENALWKSPTEEKKKGRVHAYYRRAGWKLVQDEGSK